jgi:hypothetical protein
MFSHDESHLQKTKNKKKTVSANTKGSERIIFIYCSSVTDKWRRKQEEV